jgi:hypothetical protein
VLQFSTLRHSPLQLLVNLTCLAVGTCLLTGSSLSEANHTHQTAQTRTRTFSAHEWSSDLRATSTDFSSAPVELLADAFVVRTRHNSSHGRVEGPVHGHAGAEVGREGQQQQQ